MATQLTNGAPVTVGATHVPVTDASFNPNVTTEAIRHSGLPFASSYVVPSVAPALTFTTFFKTAYDLCGGFKLAKFDALRFYMRGYTDGSATGDGDQWALKTNAEAFAHITGVAPGVGGLMMASVQVFCLAGTLNGIEDIFERTASTTIPTIAAEPTYHRIGPVSIEGAVVEGVNSISISTGNRVIPVTPNDGRVYARSLIYDGGERTIQISTDGARDTLESLTARGIKIDATNCIVYLRECDRNGVVLTGANSGASITIAKGRIDPDALSQSVGSTNSTGFMVKATNQSLDQTDPFVTSFTATVPA